MHDVNAVRDGPRHRRFFGRVIVGGAVEKERGSGFDSQLLRQRRPRVAGHQNASRTCAMSLAVAWMLSRMTSRSLPPPPLNVPPDRRAWVTLARTFPLLASTISTESLVDAEPAPNPPK